MKFYIAYLFHTILKFFGFFKKIRVYYSIDVIFGLFINFNCGTRQLYIARMMIIGDCGFEKIDIKYKLCMKIFKML